MLSTEIPMLRDRLCQLAAVFDKREPNEHAMKVWAHTLKEFAFPEISDSLDRLARTTTKMPAPGDVWKALNEQRTDRIERDSIARSKSEREEIKRTFARSDEVSRKLKALVGRLQTRTKRDPMDWAFEILDKKARGEPVSYYALQCATEVAVSNPRPGYPVEAGADLEALLEREAIQEFS